MKIKKLLAIVLCSLTVTGCAASGGGNVTESSAGADVSVSESTSLLAETTAAEIVEPPVISEDFTSEPFLAEKRGTVILRSSDDEAAEDGKALWIFNRNDAWNGVQYNAEKFRGNEIEVSGSFKSAAGPVKVSVEYSMNGLKSYDTVVSVNTSEDKYSSGSGKFIIPAGAENILVYVDAERTGDIFCDSISVRVCGDFTYYAEPAEAGYADTSDYPSLKELYKDYFKMGTATADNILEIEDFAKLVKSQFNSMTMGNSFKPDYILDHNMCVRHAEEYMYAPAVRFDSVKYELDFARDNGLSVRGHVLVWHSQTPEWLFYKDYNVGGELADRDTMLQRMENYIKSVMEWSEENYPGLIYAWDVVNEAADDGGGMRKSLWYKTIGEDYIERAFEFARKYAPEGVKLFYNDYNAFYSRKQEDILKFLKPVAEAGNIDGMGMQSHVKVTDSISTYMAALKRYHDELGVEIHVTELDVGRGNTDDWQQVQGDYYGEFMNYLVELRGTGVPITSVTVWGICDGDSWRPTEYPLPFNADLSRKPAFDKMVEAAEKSNQ